MTRFLVRFKRLAVFAGVLLVVACSAAPTAPAPAPQKTQLTLEHHTREACDSTIVTDGTCRGGWIIPW